MFGIFYAFWRGRICLPVLVELPLAVSPEHPLFCALPKKVPAETEIGCVLFEDSLAGEM